jgi:hypothetical protein
MALVHYKMQLTDLRDGQIIKTAGGAIQVCAAGSPSKVALYTKDGLPASNPVALNYGSLEFYTQDTVASVDLAGFGPEGHFVTMKGVVGKGPNEIFLDRSNRNQVAMVPFSYADSTAAVEKDTGFDLPANTLVLPDVGVLTKDTDSGITILAGTLSSESGGDADGFLLGISVASAVLVAAKSAATATRGALIGAGTLDRGHVITAANPSLSYTLSSGADTATGWLVIPYILPIIV